METLAQCLRCSSVRYSSDSYILETVAKMKNYIVISGTDGIFEEAGSLPNAALDSAITANALQTCESKKQRAVRERMHEDADAMEYVLVLKLAYTIFA